MSMQFERYYWKRFGPLYVTYNSEGGWFRIFGKGISWTKSPPLFSERMGYIKKIKIFGYRFGILKEW